MMLLGSGVVPVVVVRWWCWCCAQNGERLRRNRADRVLRSLRRTAVLIPVDRIAIVDDRVLQVEPVGAGVQVDRTEAASLVAEAEAQLVGGAVALR